MVPYHTKFQYSLSFKSYNNNSVINHSDTFIISFTLTLINFHIKTTHKNLLLIGHSRYQHRPLVAIVLSCEKVDVITVVEGNIDKSLLCIILEHDYRSTY